MKSFILGSIVSMVFLIHCVKGYSNIFHSSILSPSQLLPRIARIRGGSTTVTVTTLTMTMTPMSSTTKVSSSSSSSYTCSMERKLTELRKLFESEAIDAFIVPSDDPHMSEYTPLYFNRREYISGFTGSAGTAIILKDQAALFTDGRYHNQASLELDSKYWTLMKQGIKGVPTPTEFLLKTLSPGAVVGIDPWIHNADSVKRLTKGLEEKQMSLKLLSSNLIDQIWTEDRTPLAKNKVRIHDMAYAGQNVTSKMAALRKSITLSGAQALVVSSLDEVAWLFNLRGADVPCNPVFLSYALLTLDEAFLFIDEVKVPVEIKSELHAASIKVLPYNTMLSKLKDMLGSNPEIKKVFVDPKTINYALFSVIEESRRIESESPIIGLKAVKNDIELKGMRECHIRDGAAVVEFLSWLEDRYATTEPPMDEYDIDIHLTDKRKEMSPIGSFMDRSFPTIAGVDSNGAIIHYRASKEGCKTLTSNSMLLLDSGAQYLDGTTDVTRTFHMGQPTAYQMEIFTRVLKGHIGIDRSVFPAGTPGCLLDSYAREHLWRIGKDFIHGVGHGVGAALNVHEGPHKISRVLDAHPLIPGNIVSNEPGYYEENNFGIRIENLLVVAEKKDLPEFGGRKFLCFERLTHIPIQKKLMNKSLMTEEEIDWVNSYHKEIYNKVYPLLISEKAKKWLTDATSPL